MTSPNLFEIRSLAFVAWLHLEALDRPMQRIAHLFVSILAKTSLFDYRHDDAVGEVRQTFCFDS